MIFQILSHIFHICMYYIFSKEDLDLMEKASDLIKHNFLKNEGIS